MEKIAIVTDSTCDASIEELDSMGVRCINLRVMMPDGTPFPDGNSPENIETFYDHIESCDELPKTSMPSLVELGELYSDLAKEGYTHVISVHISEAMSGTCQAARMAAETAAIEVEVINAKSTTWPITLIVRALSMARATGATFAQLVEKGRELAEVANICFVADTLKNLVKGGRIGRATGLAAGLLDIKAIFSTDGNGVVYSLAKAKSMKRALNKIADIAEQLVAKLGPLEGYFVHTRNLEAIDTLARLFKERNIDFTVLGVRNCGPVITTHVSTGCAGFAYIPKQA